MTDEMVMMVVVAATVMTVRLDFLFGHFFNTNSIQGYAWR